MPHADGRMMFVELDDAIRKALGVQQGTPQIMGRIYAQFRVVNPAAHEAWTRYDMEAKAEKKSLLHNAYFDHNNPNAPTEDDIEEAQRLADFTPDPGEEAEAIIRRKDLMWEEGR